MNEALNPPREALVGAFPEQLREMYEIARLYLVEKGTSEDAAADAAFGICNRIRNQLGGTAVYIGKSEAIEWIERDFQIFEEHQRGADYNDLAVRYKLSTQQIRNIIRVIGKWRMEQRQGSLLDDQPKARLPANRGRKSAPFV